MTLSVKQLRYFKAIADAGALSRAAETLGVAQSALSHHVAELETVLTVQLLERRSRGVALTPAGHRLYEHAGAILSSIDKAAADVRTFTEVASGPVTVGLNHTAIELMSLPLMVRTREECADVHLTIIEGLSGGLVSAVMSGAIDIAIAYNPTNDARLRSEPLLVEDIVLVGRPEIIGRSKAPIPFGHIPQKQVLGLNTVQASRAILESQILRNMIVPSATLELDSLSAMRKALKSGLGCSILARSTVASELAEGSLHFRPIIKPKVTRQMELVFLADRPKTRAFTEVCRILTDVVRREVSSGGRIARWRGARD